VKKTLLLSVVTSTMIMASGDSGWNFNGQAVVYTQTVDAHGTGDLFSGDTTYGSTGLQLGATNKNIVSGIGAGIELSGIAQTPSYSSIPDEENSFRFPFFGGGDAQVDSGDITQAYVTYGVNNTSVKVGRQRLPKSLSPFAYSEGWQVFKNTMEAALVVNSDIPNTKLVYGAVGKANSSIGRLDNFDSINENGNIVHMITAQNKSVEGLKLTGTYYYAPDMLSDGKDVDILWGDAKFKVSDYSVALQGGQLSGDGVDSTSAFGAKVAGKFNAVNASVAYSSVDDGAFRVTNLATMQKPSPGVGIKSPLYTQMVLNNIGNHQAANSDWLKLSANTKVANGTLIASYGTAMENGSPEVGNTGSAFGKNPYEVDLIYKIKINPNTKLFAAYVLTDRDRQTVSEDPNNFLRFWARYTF